MHYELHIFNNFIYLGDREMLMKFFMEAHMGGNIGGHMIIGGMHHHDMAAEEDRLL